MLASKSQLRKSGLKKIPVLYADFRAHKLIVFFNHKETYPARIKGIHFINYPKIFDVALSVIKMFLKDKTKDRVISLFHLV
jgi:hypothetical protein